MRRRTVSWSLLLALLVGALVPSVASAQAPEGAILLIMDASGSMEATDDDGVRLIDGAKDALRGVVDSLPDGTHVGLRVYGHREPNTDQEAGCQDTELISPVQPLDRDAMRTAIDSFEPSGFTPIGASLQAAADDLPPEGPRTIILVSDGEDTCSPPDPCEVAADLRGDGVDLVVETVGFALGTDEAARAQLECIAEAGGGTFTDVATAAELVEQLEVVSTREARRFELGGTPVKGGALTLEAPTLEPNVDYVDTILGGEFLYYRIDVSGLEGELFGRAIRGPDENGDGGPDIWVGWVNSGDSWIRGGTHNYAENNRAPSAIVQSRTIDVTDLDEAYFRVELRTSSESEYPLQVTLVAAGAATEVEEDEADEPDEPDEEVETPTDVEDEPVAAEPAGSGGLPTWAAVVITLLVVLVLGLGALVAVLFRRTSATAGTASTRPPPPPA